MDCQCVYQAMHDIKRECRYLTQRAQQAHEHGAVTEANANLLQAFSRSKQLLELPVVLPDGVHYFVKACFNCIEYCYVEDDLFRTRQLQTAAGALGHITCLKIAALADTSLKITSKCSCTGVYTPLFRSFSPRLACAR